MPVVVLVHGSGPHDRDSTFMGAKIFRDLAAGLSSSGIAVLRYEKRSLEHGFKMSAEPATLDRDTTDDAIYAKKISSAKRKVLTQITFSFSDIAKELAPCRVY